MLGGRKNEKICRRLSFYIALAHIFGLHRRRLGKSCRADFSRQKHGSWIGRGGKPEIQRRYCGPHNKKQG